MGLWIVVDILLIAMLVCGCIIGVKRGFIRSVTKPLRALGSFALAFALADPISVNIIEPIIGASLTNQFSDYLTAHCADPNAEIPTLVKFAASIVNVDLEGKTVAQIVESIAAPLVHIVTVIITFVLVYLLAKLLLTVVFAFINALFESSVLEVPNKIVGCVFNTLMGAVTAWMFVLFFNFVIHLDALSTYEWATGFTGGPIYQFFLNLSPLELLLGF